MPTSIFFQNADNRNEQKLIDDLIVESIKQFGIDCFYLPRTIKNQDLLYGTDTVSEYNSSYLMEFYVKSTQSLSAQSEFLSKFNVEIRDQIYLSCAVRSFYENVGAKEGINRPREGDLLWIPMSNDAVVIKYVDPKPVFYQMGTLQFFDITCEMWEYSSEILNTGVADFDAMQQQFSIDRDLFSILTGNGQFFVSTSGGYPLIQGQEDQSEQSALEDNLTIQQEADDIVDFSAKNVFGDITR
jgi:hypothetical protein